MSMFTRFAAVLGGALLILATAAAQADYVDPPSRVARLSHVRGELSFSPAGEDEWVDATRNRPLIRGDRLWAGRGGRAELQAGNATFRIDEGTSFQILNLDDRTAQVEITQGTLNLRVRRIYEDQIFEVDTPTLAFVVSRPGEYRIDVDPRSNHTTVAVWDGGGEAHGEQANFRIREGEAIRFYDTRLQDYEVFDIPRPDDFDRFCMERDERAERSVSRRYVSEDLIGYSDLDEYGSWSEVTEYGNVWFPSRVAVDWAPYRDGHWIWQDPWGWTWVDDSDWGFAPFHYGRWVNVRSRWGWIPGPVAVRPVYAPALVAFVGGPNFSVGINVGRPIGWFPLGPREVYVPPYRASRNYFTNVNVTNTVINNTYITNIYNDYSSGRNRVSVNYHNRGVAGAITAVSSDAFVNSRSVRQQMITLDRQAAVRAEVTQMAALAPTARSVVGSGRVSSAPPQRGVFDRAVVARSAPPQSIVPFADRQAALQRQPGRGLGLDAMQSLQRTPRAGAPDVSERVRVVGDGGRANVRSADGERLERGTAMPGRDGGRVAQPREGMPTDRGPGERTPADRGRSERQPMDRGPGERAPVDRGPPQRRDGTLAPPERDFTRPGGRGENNDRPVSNDRTAPSREPSSGRFERPARQPREDNVREAPAQREIRQPIQREERNERPAPQERFERPPVRERSERVPPQERNERQPIQRDESSPRFERREPVQREPRQERPVVREERIERPAPQERIERAPPQERIERQPIQRSEPSPRVERREAPPQRSEPAPRVEAPQRAEPPPRAAPVERAPPPQRMERSAPPQERSAPPQERRDNDGERGGRKDGDERRARDR